MAKRYKRPHIHWTIKQRIWKSPCAVCGKTGDTVIDHIVPVSKGGSSDESNLQPLCALCNGMKNNRLTNEGIALVHRWRRSGTGTLRQWVASLGIQGSDHGI